MILKLFLSILLTIAPILSYAQVDYRTLEANGMLGVIAPMDLVKNSDLDLNTNDVVWSGTSFNPVCTGADVILGKCSGAWLTGTSGDTLRFISYATIPNAWFGGNCQAYFTYQFASVAGANTTAFKAYAVNASLVKISPEITLNATYDSLGINQGKSNLGQIPAFKCPDAGDAVYVVVEHTASVTTIFNIDDVHVRQDTSNAPMKISTQPTAYTPTLTNLGTGATSNLQWDQDGSKIHITGTITCGTSVPGSTASVSLPNSATTASNIPSVSQRGTWALGAASVAHGGFVLVAPSVSTFGLTSNDPFGSVSSNSLSFANGSGVCGASQTISINATIPISGASNINATTSQCLQDGSCVNTLSAKVSNTGVVTDNSYSLFSGSCVWSPTGTASCPVASGKFSVVPNCVANAQNDASNRVNYQPASSSVTSLVFQAMSGASLTTAANTAFTVVCNRAGADVKPVMQAPWVSGSLTVDGSNPYRKARAFIASTGTVTYLSGVTPWLTSCGSTSGKSCTFLNTPASTPQCLTTTQGTSSASVTNIQTISSTGFTLNGFLTNTAAASNVDVVIDCEWSR